MGARYSAGDLLQKRTLVNDDGKYPNFVLILDTFNSAYNGVTTEAYTVFWLDTWHGADAAVYDWIEKYYTLFSTLDT